jgi:hypothetical protein
MAGVVTDFACFGLQESAEAVENRFGAGEIGRAGIVPARAPARQPRTRR